MKNFPYFRLHIYGVLLLCLGLFALNTQAQTTFGEQQVIVSDSIIGSEFGARDVYAADMDNDGDIDALSANDYASGVSWYENAGNGPTDYYEVPNWVGGTEHICAADFDNDGYMDILSSSSYFNGFETGGVMYWHRNNGNGTFTMTSSIGGFVSFTTSAIDVADLDNDGDTDIISGAHSTVWHENDGAGNFVDHLIESFTWATAINAADLDDDGDNDILIAYSDGVAWYQNDGMGNFDAQQIITTDADGAYSVYATDLDGDGDNDVLSASVSDDKIAWYENDGLGNFGTQQIITTNADYANSVYAIDLDNDGDNDVLSASPGDSKIAWYENDGLGNFGTQQIITVNASGATSVYAADLDNDGDNDVLSASYYDGKIAWYENLGLLPSDALPPIADFSTIPSPNGSSDTIYICSGQTVYTDNLSQNATTYLWNFGDGYTDNTANPTHTYTQAGTYTLSLIASNNTPNSFDCEANSGDVVIGDIIGNNSYGYNDSPNYTQSYMTFDVNGNLLNTNSDVLDAFEPLGYYVALVNYYTADVVPSNTLAGLQAQVSNGECIHISVHEMCELLIGYDISAYYSDDYGGYVLDYSREVPLPEHDDLSYYDYYVFPYHVVQAMSGMGGSYTLVDSDYTPFALGDTVVFCPGECCQTLIIGATAGGGIVSDNPLQNRPNSEWLADTATVVVVVQASQAPDITCISTLCANDTAQYHTTANCSSYTWNVTGGTIIAGQGTTDITVVWADIPNGVVSLSAECGDDYCNLPTVAAIPVLTASAAITGDPLICQNEISHYNLPFWDGTTYVWTIDPPQAGTVVLGNNSHQIAVQWTDMAANIQVNYYNNLLGCQGSASMAVTPAPSFDIDTLNKVCVGNVSNISTNVSNNYNFLWSVTGGNIIAGQNSNNIVVEWTTAGIGTVTALSNDPNVFCNTSATANMVVVPLPQSPNIVGDTLICPNQTYNYMASPLQNNTTFNWTVVGGTLESGQNTPNISVIWGDTPPYSLSVVRETDTEPACSSVPSTLSISSLAIDGTIAINGNNMVCPAATLAYSASPATNSVVYEWSISPDMAGQIVSGQNTPNITVQWAAFAVSDATLNLSVCGQNAIYPINFAAVPQPTIVQSNVLCSDNTTTLSVNGSDISQYAWFNEDGINISNNPTLVINQGGIYSVEVANSAGCVGNTWHSVSENTSPVADILSPSSTVCIQAPFNIPLMAIDGTNYAFEWLQNGVPMAGANTPYYTHIGTSEEAVFAYQAMVTDTSNNCQTWSDVINIAQLFCVPDTGGTGGIDTTIILPPDTVALACPPSSLHEIDFSLDNITGSDCRTLVLNQLSTGTFLSFIVYWGDGTNQVLSTPTATHTYPSGINIYPVTLMGIFEHPDTNTICNLQKTLYYEVPIAARFDASPACLGAEWQFQDRSYYLPNNDIVTWAWDFGDGSPAVSGNQTATHTYFSAGIFMATLTISNGTCADSRTMSIEVLPLPALDFNVSGGLCINNVLNFVPSSNIPINNYIWDFGDGTTFTGANAAHQYSTTGTYTISLQATTDLGCVGVATPQSITINALPIPEAITATDTLLCMGETATLTAPNGTAYIWTNGSTNNAISVNQSGNYSVNVMADGGCYYTTAPITVQFILPPDANIYPTGDTIHFCQGADNRLYVNPSDNYTYNWSNGTNNSYIPIEYAFNNTYSVTVTDTQSGCSASDNTVVDSPYEPIPTPEIAMNPAAICEGEFITLWVTNEIADIDHFVWTNGVQDTLIQVNTAGNYGVYAVDEWGCASDTSLIATVNVNALPNINLFPTGCHEICAGDPLVFPPYAAADYQWFFNGNPIGDNSNEFTPAQDGDYYVIMTNEAGCTDTSGILTLQIVNDCPQEVLPIQLVQFDGIATPKGNQLYWTSASEMNCAYYTLHHSPDGNAFTPIANITAKGNSTVAQQYQHLHDHKAPISYYSLSQTDHDGTMRHLSTIVLRRNEAMHSPNLSVYPNPTQNLLHLHYQSPELQTINLQLYDIMGRVVQQHHLQVQMGNNTHTLNIANLPNGCYYLHLGGEVLRIMKQ
jgi:PKD repeat protein